MKTKSTCSDAVNSSGEGGKLVAHPETAALVMAPKEPSLVEFFVYSQLIIASFIGLNFVAHSLSLPQLPFSILFFELFLCFVSIHPALAKILGPVSRLIRH